MYGTGVRHSTTVRPTDKLKLTDFAYAYEQNHEVLLPDEVELDTVLLDDINRTAVGYLDNTWKEMVR